MKGNVMVKYFRMCNKLILVALVVMLLVPQTAKADELGDLKKQLAALQRRLEQIEAKQANQDKAVDAKIARAVDAKQVAALPDSLKWVDTLKWSGDLRYRHEYIDDQAVSTFNTKNRHRVRARLKLQAEVNDEVDVTVRLASGSDDSPTSTNQTLGESGSNKNSTGFSTKELWLDMAYADWHPNWLSGTNILMGKMEMPFYKAGKNQMIWDSDLTLEGIAVKHKVSLNSDTTLHVTGGGFWVKEDSATDDISIFAGQGYLQHKLDGGEKLIGGISLYNYGNMKGNSVDGFGFKGNSNTGTDGVYTSDYNILEAFGELAFKIGDTPASVYGSYVNNVGAINNSEDSGFLVGAKYNKAKKPGTWEVGYNYRNIEADAVVGGLNDSDFVDGGTNGKGHKFGYKYQLSKNMQGAITFFTNEKNANTTEDNYQRLQADLIFKF